MRAKTEQIGTQLRIAMEVIGERERQDLKWGGPSHDDQHSASDWIFFIRDLSQSARGRDARRLLLQCAALAVAGIEAIDRKAHAARAAQLGIACSSGAVAEAAIAAGLAERISPHVVRYLSTTDSAYWAAFSRFAAILSAPHVGDVK